MRFYTNVQLIGNQFLVRGYDNGKHVMFKEEYTPTLFVPSKKESKYKTLVEAEIHKHGKQWNSVVRVIKIEERRE